MSEAEASSSERNYNEILRKKESSESQHPKNSGDEKGKINAEN
jgi:hypothetical protein